MMITIITLTQDQTNNSEGVFRKVNRTLAQYITPTL